MPNIDDPRFSLTPREREVLALAQQGRTNNQIAAELGITRNAVRFHLKDIHGKLETGSKRNILTRGWVRGLGLAGFPFVKLGVPTTIAVFAGGIVLTGYAAYRAFPGEAAQAAPGRFEGTVLIDGKYPNGCPTQYSAGTMTLADFAYGRSTLEELRGLNPGLSDGPLPPETMITVPYNPNQTCSEAQQTPGAVLESGGNITRVLPSEGAEVSQESTKTFNSLKPSGVCAEVNFAGAPETGQWFRMSVDGNDVTSTLVWTIPPGEPASGRVCFAPEQGLAPGSHSAEVVVRDPKDPNAKPRQRVQWSFLVV